MQFINYFLQLSYIITISFAIDAHLTNNEDIIGGKPIHISNAAHLVSVRHKKNDTTPFQHRCSGTIYSNSIILTTAICVAGLETQHLHIIAGTSYYSQFDGYVYPVDKYVIHPDFNIWFMDNDLAILHLPFNLINTQQKIIAPIALASALPNPGELAKIAVWGATLSCSHMEYLQMAVVEIVDDEKCKKSYGGERITGAMLCAGGAFENGSGYVDACVGDAGSALVVNDVAVGLVSWGNGCGSKDFPGVYTNLVFLKEWIEDEVTKFH